VFCFEAQTIWNLIEQKFHLSIHFYWFLNTTNRNPENDLRIEINDLLTHPSPPWCPGAHQKLLNFNGSALRDTIWLAKIPVRWPMVAHGGPYGQLISYGRNLV